MCSAVVAAGDPWVDSLSVGCAGGADELGSSEVEVEFASDSSSWGGCGGGAFSEFADALLEESLLASQDTLRQGMGGSPSPNPQPDLEPDSAFFHLLNLVNMRGPDGFFFEDVLAPGGAVRALSK